MRESLFATLFCKKCLYFERRLEEDGYSRLPWCRRYETDINGRWCGTAGGVLTEEERIESKDW